MAKPAKPNYPEWTEYKKKNGLDPLGMQNSSVGLYQTFIPGISNVTLRMRYYGLYAWLSWIYARRIGDTNPESWKRFIRRAEALYALMAARRGGETGVAGINWAQRTLAAVKSKTIDFRADAEPGSDTYYFKLAWGVYGLAYASQLFEVGIYERAQAHEIPVPSAAIGEKLAQVFDKELGDLAAPFYATIRRGRVTLSELDLFARLCPSEIRKGGSERNVYQNLLFAQNGIGGAHGHSRRLSLLLILKVAAQLGYYPSPDEIRWILYAGKDETGRVFDPGSAECERQRRRWQVYHANDLCHLALEALLKFMLDVLGGFPRGITPSTLIATCVEQITAATAPVPESWNDFLGALVESGNAYDPKTSQSPYRLAQDILSASQEEEFCSSEIAWKALILLGLLHRRFRADAANITRELGDFEPAAFHSLLTEARFLEECGDAPFSWTIARLIEGRVMRRHLWVALRKFRHQGDYTFLIEIDEGLVRLREKDGPVFTNPRLGPSVRFLEDIHLIGDGGLTPRGVEVLNAA